MLYQESRVIKPIKLEDEVESDTQKRRDNAKKQNEKEREADENEQKS